MVVAGHRDRRSPLVADAALGFVSRWFSARIGEGLIYDLRTQVFDHVQRQPIAFFTRTQTGALVSRLNNDVIGAQQAVHLHPVRGASPTSSSLVVVLVTMFALSWQVSRHRAGADPAVPAARAGWSAAGCSA